MDVEWEIKSTELSDAGLYSCVATNHYGNTTRDIGVKIIDGPLSVTIPKSKYIVEETQSQIVIPCLLSPKSKSHLKVKWFFNGIEIDTDGEVYKVKMLFFKLFSMKCQSYIFEI